MTVHNESHINLFECGLNVGDVLEMTDWMDGGKPLGIFGEVVDSGTIRINGYSGTYSLSGGCSTVYRDIFPVRYSDRKAWSFQGPKYWVSPRHEGKTVSELSPRVSSRVRVNKTVTPTRVECGKGTHVFGGGYTR